MPKKNVSDDRRGGEFSAALKAWRKRQGLTQVEAAQSFGVSRMHWSYMERGTSAVSKITLLACAAIDAGLEEWRPGQNYWIEGSFGSQSSSVGPVSEVIARPIRTGMSR